MIPSLQEKIEEFRAKFGQFYISIDSKTKAIRVVDIENGIKVNGEDGSLIECVASNNIEKWIDQALLSARTDERRKIREEIESKRQEYIRECQHYANQNIKPEMWWRNYEAAQALAAILDKLSDK